MRYSIKKVSTISLPLVLVFFLFGASTAQPEKKSNDKILSRGGHQSLSAKTGRGENVRVIVKVTAPFKPMAETASPQSRQQMGRIASTQDALLSELSTKKMPRAHHKYRYVPYIFMEVDGPALEALIASPLVEYIHEDTPKKAHLGQSVPRIGAPTMWSSGYTGSGRAVAILDTGVDKNHPFLAGAVVSEACFSSTSTTSTCANPGDPFYPCESTSHPWTVESICPGGVTSSTANGSAMPYGGTCPLDPDHIPPIQECDHGTHVSGIIAGRQNVTGSSGPGGAPGAGIIAIQVFSRFNLDADCGGAGSAPCVMAYDSDIIKGLDRVYELSSTISNIAAVNLSIGGGQYFSAAECDTNEGPTKAAIDNLKMAGIATVASSGNDGYCDSMEAPACISSVVSVGATTDSDTVAPDSNSASFLSLLAPGSLITSSVPGGGYEEKSGTSMAAPHVSGAWALIKHARPFASVDQVLASLTSTGLPVTNSKCGQVTKKRIIINQALNTLNSGAPLVKTEAADGIGNDSATLHGTVNANGNNNTTVTFEYGTTPAYGNTVSAAPGTVSGNVNTPLSAAVTGLAPNTFYHFRVKATTPGIGTSYDNEMTFSTSGPCGSIADGSFEESLSPSPAWDEHLSSLSPLCDVTDCGTDNDTAGPRTGNWWAWFGGTSATEYGSLIQDIIIPSGSAPRLEFHLWNGRSSGNGTDVFSVMIDDTEIFSSLEGNPLFTGGYTLASLDLSPFADDNSHTLVLQSSTNAINWTNFSVDDVSMSCVTGAVPAVATGPAVSVPGTGATIYGSVLPYGTDAYVIFDYGTTTQYGSTVTATPGTVGGNTLTAVSAALTGLDPGVTYHYRIRGQNAVGIAYGVDGTFPSTCPAAEAKIGGTNYTDIELAVSTAIDGDEIRMNTALFSGPGSTPVNPVFAGNGTVTLKGGYDCAFSQNPNFSTIIGKITFGGGKTVIIENIVIQ
ncbi:MAG: S8 family serine peptidase [Nitrospirae bacterium]|nr:S8 family serine peptidase [Nitrospirota bacterium]